MEVQCEPCDEEFGQRRFKRMQGPKLPTPEGITDHDLSHLPYRSWCRHCVKGRCKENPHETNKELTTMNEAHFDFAFLGKEGEPGKLLPMLVVKERITGMTMASGVPSKSTGAFITKRGAAYFKQIGCELGDLTVKSDQEPTVIALLLD